MKFYDEHGENLFQAGKTFPGLKMVLGGQQSFAKHSLAAAVAPLKIVTPALGDAAGMVGAAAFARQMFEGN